MSVILPDVLWMSVVFDLETAVALKLTCRAWAALINEDELAGCAYADFYDASPELVYWFEKASGRNFYDAIACGGVRMGRLLRMVQEDRYTASDGLFWQPMDSAVCAVLIGTVVRCAGCKRGAIAVTEAQTLCAELLAVVNPMRLSRALACAHNVLH
jgi:hypothetical protein